VVAQVVVLVFMELVVLAAVLVGHHRLTKLEVQQFQVKEMLAAIHLRMVMAHVVGGVVQVQLDYLRLVQQHIKMAVMVALDCVQLLLAHKCFMRVAVVAVQVG
jgi:hypothetical protein